MKQLSLFAIPSSPLVYPLLSCLWGKHFDAYLGADACRGMMVALDAESMSFRTVVPPGEKSTVVTLPVGRVDRVDPSPEHPSVTVSRYDGLADFFSWR